MPAWPAKNAEVPSPREPKPARRGASLLREHSSSRGHYSCCSLSSNAAGSTVRRPPSVATKIRSDGPSPRLSRRWRGPAGPAARARGGSVPELWRLRALPPPRSHAVSSERSGALGTCQRPKRNRGHDREKRVIEAQRHQCLEIGHDQQRRDQQQLQQEQRKENIPARKSKAREGVAGCGSGHQLHGKNAAAHNDRIEIPERKIAALPSLLEVTQAEWARGVNVAISAGTPGRSAATAIQAKAPPRQAPPHWRRAARRGTTQLS
jgi:hypothetical protein